MTTRWKSLLAGALTLCTTISTASAGGFYVARFGGEEGGVTGRHATSIYYNPAGIVFGTGTRLYAEGLVGYRQASYERPAQAVDRVLGNDDAGSGTPVYAVYANAGTASLGNWVASPFVGVVSNVGSNFAVGMAVFAPFGGSADWDTASDERIPGFPGAADGVQRWWALEGSLRSMYVSGAAAYRVPSLNLALGASLSWVQSDTSTIRARTATGTDDMISSNGMIVEGRSLLEAESTNYALGFGAQFSPLSWIRAGVSYQSQPGFGEMRLEGTLTNKMGASAETETEIEMRQALPDIWRAGVEIDATPSLALSTQVTFARWSVFERQCILDRNMPDRNCALTADGGVDMEGGARGVVANLPRDWQNTLTLSASARYRLSQRVLLLAGGAYDPSAVPDETLDPALMDMPKVSGTAGIKLPLGTSVSMSAQFSHVFYFDRSIAVRARDADGQVVAPANPSRSPDAAGDYSQSVSFMTLGVETRF